MPSRRNPTGRTRRELMAIMGIGGAAGLAGCLGDDGDGGDETPTPTEDPGGGDQTPTPTPPPAERQVMGTYRSGISSDGDTTIPFLITDTTSGNMVSLVLDGAYAVTSNDQIMPLWMDLTTEDSQVFTAELRDNLQWSDPYGEMTAEDWVWYIQNIHQSDWAASVDASSWEGISVERTGNYTFEIDVGAVIPSFPLQPTLWGAQIAPKSLLEDYVSNQDLEGIQTDEDLVNLTYTGNVGPYTLDEWERDSAWRTVRNDEYYMRDLDASDFPDYLSDEEIEAWQGSPYFEGYEYSIIPEEATRLSALRTGDIDNATIPGQRVPEFQQAVDDVYVNLAPQPFLEILAYAQRTSGWEEMSDADPEYDGPGIADYGNPNADQIRGAVSMSIDKQFVADVINNGLADPAQTFQPEWSQFYGDEGVTEYGVGDTYSHDQAREMLEQNLSDGYGYDNGTLIAPEGHDRWDAEQVTLQVVHTAGSQTNQDIAERMLQELSNVGIDIEINSVVWETLLGQYLPGDLIEGVDEPTYGIGPGTENPGHPHETVNLQSWDIQFGIGFNTYPRTPSSTDVFWTKEAALNYYGYRPPTNMGPNSDMTMREMYDTAATEADLESRRQMFIEMFNQLSADQPVNFFLMGVDTPGYRNRVVGPTEEFGYGWDYQTNYFDPEIA